MSSFTRPPAGKTAAASDADHKLQETRRSALSLMRDLGARELGIPLQALGWRFAFDRARRRLGSCRWHPDSEDGKRITVSRHYAARLGPTYVDQSGLAVIDDVIRHEIAHAIDFERRGRSDHGPKWKSICRRVGADPSRTYESAEIVSLIQPGKYRARCPRCEREISFFRRPSRPRACRPCCDEFAGGRFDERYRLEISKRF